MHCLLGRPNNQQRSRFIQGIHFTVVISYGLHPPPHGQASTNQPGDAIQGGHDANQLQKSLSVQNGNPIPAGIREKKISAKAIMKDINSGLDDVSLLQKYVLSARQLTAL